MLAKPSPLPTDPLTPKSAKRSLRAVTESESNPLCSQAEGSTKHRGGVCDTEGGYPSNDTSESTASSRGGVRRRDAHDRVHLTVGFPLLAE